MSTTCHSTATGRPFATAFFGGADRGKVVQLHMNPDDLDDLILSLSVEDEHGIVEPFADWLKGQCANARMVLFDRGLGGLKADPSIPLN